MDREAITEKIAAKVYKGCYPQIDKEEIDKHVGDVLTQAGFFDLLEAAVTIRNRCIYSREEWQQFEAAIRVAGQEAVSGILEEDDGR
jgi:hypothetical protein